MRVKFLAFFLLFLSTYSFSYAASSGVKHFTHPYHSELGEDLVRSGLVINLSTAEVKEWRQQGVKNVFLALNVLLQNNSEIKKLDLSKGFTFTLTDEFHNEYRLVDPPDDYEKEVMQVSKNYPSLYPGELYSQVVFFEAPVKTSRFLILSLFAPEAGIDEPVNIRIPMDKVVMKEIEIQEQYSKAIQNILKDNDLYDPHSSDKLKITRPFTGKPVLPGEVIHIKVKLSEKMPAPDELLVITPMYTLTDKDLVFGYNLRVPENHPKGELTVIVIARWNKGGKILSDSITFKVVDKTENCLEDCLSKHEK